MLTGAALAGTANAAQQWGEISNSTSLGMYPQDCATSLDNLRGAVRYANPGLGGNAAIVSVFDLVGAVGSGAPGGAIVTHGGGTLKSGEQTDVTGTTNGFKYRPSDRIELSNDWGVSIGTGVSGIGGFTPDETYIEAFIISGSSPSYFVQFEQNPTSANYTTDRAGFAHDLAITRNAEMAVVNSENWIHFVALGTATATHLPGLNIGGLTAGPCNPDGAVDSVAVTNTRAVVTTARYNSGLNTFTTWVYIVDLSSSSGPTIVLEHEILPTDPEWTPYDEDDDDRPHDVVITPTRDGGGEMAVVTTNHSTAFFELQFNTFLGSDFEGKFRRKYQKQVDSVEATGDRVVVIADDHPPGPGSTSNWAIRMYDLGATNVEQPIRTWVDTSPPMGGSHAHDLAIDWDFDVGLIRTSFEDVVINSLMTPPTSPNELASTSDAYAYEGYSATTGRRTFSSDSVVVGSEQDGKIYGVTIGARQIGSTYVAVADIIDLLSSTPTVTDVDILPTDEFNGCVPLDLAISFNQDFVIVRNTDEVDQIAPTGDGPDMVIIPITGGTMQRFGGSGTVYGVDSLAAPSLFGYVRTNRRLMSISEEHAASGADFTHFVR